MLIIDSIFLLPDVIALNYISMFMLISTGNVYVCFVICHGVIILKEGRKEGTYLFDQTTIVNTIHIYENAMVRRLSLRLNIAASATATEIIIIII